MENMALGRKVNIKSSGGKMENTNNQNINPVDYLNSISSAAPESTPTPIQNMPVAAKKSWWVILVIVLALIAAIGMVIFSVVGIVNGQAGDADTQSTVTEDANTMFKVVEDSAVFPNLGANYDVLGLRSEGLVAATRKEDGATVFLNDRNTLVFTLDEQYRLAGYEFHDGRLPVVCQQAGGETKFGYLDAQGNLVIGCDYDYASNFENGKALTLVRTPIDNGEAVKVLKQEIDTDGKVLSSSEEIMTKSDVLPAL